MARRTQAERTAETRSALIETARKAFAEQGYAHVRTEELAESCGMTRGALYHHFDGKLGLFEAVVIEIQKEITAEIDAAATAEDDPWEGIKAGCAAYVNASVRPDMRQILLVDAISVLGLDRWRALDTEYGFASLQVGLQECVDAGALPPQPLEPLARIINGAVNEAALWLAEDPNNIERRKAIFDTLNRMLDGFVR